MNRIFIRTLYSLLMILAPMLALSQPKLKIEEMTATPEDTLYYPNQSAIRYTLIVKNIGNNQLTGACAVRFTYNQSAGFETKWNWQASNFEVGQTDTIVFTDSITGLNQSRHKGGDNIIVIWPHTDNPSAQIPDTTRDSVYIWDMLVTPSPGNASERLQVYPNPTSSKIDIRLTDGRYRLERVRIMAIDGRIIEEQSRLPESIDLSDLTSGLYLAEFRFKDGAVATFKILKK